MSSTVWKRLSGAASLAVFLIASSVALLAQGTASIQGVVTDPSKAVVASAKVTLTDNDTGLNRSSTTQEHGEYQFTQVKPGHYVVTIEAPGFAVTKSDLLQLLVDTPITFDVSLKVASAASTVDVQADAVQLNTVDASVGNAFDEQKVGTLPIQTRNAAQLLSLQPGVTQSGEVMGARRDQNNITLDGVDSNDNQNALSGQNGNNNGALVTTPNSSPTSSSSSNSGFNSALPVPLDSVQEFRVTVAGGGAAEGHSSGGQVALVTRSGTNTFHGSAYEYNRNTAYTANNFFNNYAGVARPQLVRNQFGASLGGPIKKDRLFFFGNYERRIDSSQQTQSRTVPSDSLRQGIIKFQDAGGTLYSLTPAQVTAADPLKLGVSNAMLRILNSYPQGNDPALGLDKGLNFNGFLFNAPVKLDYRVYVARLDWNIDSAGKHTLSFRGTLSNEDQTNFAAQFGGQSPASQLLQDNRGFGARYTTIISPTLVNNANIGLTRIGNTTTGSTNTSLSFGGLSTLENFVRGNGRTNPNWNYTDDLNWTHGTHTFTFGGNILTFDNRLLSYSNSFYSYSFSRGNLLGLGSDINADVLSVVGNPNLKLSNGTALTTAMGDVLGILTGGTLTYNYLANGSTVPIGQPTRFDFRSQTYGFYAQDSWKLTPKLTINYGLRYEYARPVYEATGLQVTTGAGLDQYFGTRAYAATQGIPGNTLPNSDMLTYVLNGPKYGKPSWYGSDPNNFAPRIGIAYAMNSKTTIRAGFGLAYDQFGNDLAANMSQYGAVGLTSQQSFPLSYNFSSAPRYTGSALPPVPAAPAGGFPYTPGLNRAISGTIYGISPSLVAPYAELVNISVARQLPKDFTLEVGYVGRFARKLLAQQDVSTPLLYFKDPKSGVTLAQASTQMQQLYNGGLTSAGVKSNPNSIATNAFVEDQFPSLKNYYFPGSATANYFYGIYGVYAGSVLDNLHALDRVTSAAYPNCMSVSGCFTYFAPQSSSNPTWFNAADSNYDALTVSLRRAYRSGLSFDFNYTWSHSIDNASVAASGAGRSNAVLQNAFLPGLSRGSSDFDLRHQFNANFLYQLPFGRGQKMFGNAPIWLEEVVGGWQLSGLVHIQSGLPSTITGDGPYNTNYYAQTLAIPVAQAPTTGTVQHDQYTLPSLYASTTATSQYTDDYTGGVGARALVRMPWQRDVDIAVNKSFAIPWEHQSLTFRAEAFNLFNFVNFTNVSLSLGSPGTFGEFTAASDPRVLQLALRYSF